MSTELFFKDIIFVSLFASMLAFLVEARTLSGTVIIADAASESVDAVAAIESLSEAQQRSKLLGNPTATTTATGSRATTSSITTATTGLTFSSFFLGTSLFSLTYILFSRWIESGHPPLSSLYESLLFLIWNFITIFFILDRAFSKNTSNLSNFSNFVGKVGSVKNLLGDEITGYIKNTFGFLVSASALFINTFAEWQLPDDMREIKSLIPALQSNWLLMHVSIMIISYASLFLGCILSVTYLVLNTYRFIGVAPVEVNTTTATTTVSTSITSSAIGSADFAPLKSINLQEEVKVSANLLGTAALILNAEDQTDPLEETIDMLSYKLLSFGFPLLTLGILSGAIWANEAWGSYWSWDPKETWAFVTWLVFAFYLHTRVQYGWGGRKSAFVALFGFFIVWICYLGVNLLGKGLHSYGWIAS